MEDAVITVGPVRVLTANAATEFPYLEPLDHYPGSTPVSGVSSLGSEPPTKNLCRRYWQSHVGSCNVGEIPSLTNGVGKQNCGVHGSADFLEFGVVGLPLFSHRRKPKIGTIETLTVGRPVMPGALKMCGLYSGKVGFAVG
ncbi:hypothetical protein F0562_025482 [Nyssa sinensis]|uniref:Uncharacterized protein n=1 Tax=Nyssa sinensis TaxID=561372 RepID=A0A5J5B8J6_9ASTE|nr:hypothetical protein F0562_025482 [Nyssa sinensis]